VKPTERSLSRREFARRAALGSAASLLGLPEAPAAPSQLPESAAKLSEAGRAEAEARYQAILARYPERFAEAQKADLKRLCLAAQPPLDQLRAFAVANGDPPALVLKPLVERDRKPAAPDRKSPVPEKP
jgi:hypothetical protein